MSWQDIPLFDNYEINTATEQVRNKKTGLVLAHQITGGLPRVALRQGGRTHRLYVHMILRGEVALAVERPRVDEEDRSKWLPDCDEWRTIPRYERYQITRDGRVRKRDDGLELTRTDCNGFAKVSLRVSGKQHAVMLHYTIAKTYMPRFDRKTHRIIFKDDDRQTFTWTI